jgi:hypothetical protein
MKASSVIFEGELVRMREYLTQDRSRLYYTSEIRILQSVRGNLTAGTVQVTHKGLEVENATIDEKTGRASYSLPVTSGHENGTGGIELPANKRIVFFCRPLPKTFQPMPRRLETTNPTSLEVIGLAYDLFRNNTIISDVGGRFAGLPQLYSYLTNTFQVAEPTPERTLTQAQIDSAGRSNRYQGQLRDERMREMREAQKKRTTTNQRPSLH